MKKIFNIFSTTKENRLVYKNGASRPSADLPELESIPRTPGGKGRDKKITPKTAHKIAHDIIENVQRMYSIKPKKLKPKEQEFLNNILPSVTDIFEKNPERLRKRHEAALSRIANMQEVIDLLVDKSGLDSIQSIVEARGKIPYMNPKEQEFAKILFLSQGGTLNAPPKKTTKEYLARLREIDEREMAKREMAMMKKIKAAKAFKKSIEKDPKKSAALTRLIMRLVQKEAGRTDILKEVWDKNAYEMLFKIQKIAYRKQLLEIIRLSEEDRFSNRQFNYFVENLADALGIFGGRMAGKSVSEKRNELAEALLDPKRMPPKKGQAVAMLSKK